MASAARPVFIADTCVCGLSVVKSLWQRNRAGQAVFLADYAVNPLGVRNDAEIADVAERWIRLAGQHADTLVIACNTLSIRYRQLKRSGQSFTGLRRIVTMADCLEAMVRTEAARLDGLNVLIIGTEFTASQPVYPEIFATALPRTRVSAIGATELERKIARFQLEEGDVEPLVGAALERAIGEADAAVLACTCFPLVRSELESRFPRVLFLDPGEYCADLLKPDTAGLSRSLSIEVSGDAVAKERVTEFAKTLLGSDSVAAL